MDKKAYIYRSDTYNNMRFVCSGETKEIAEEKLFGLLGERFSINWSDISRNDPRAGLSLWHGVVIEHRSQK